MSTEHEIPVEEEVLHLAMCREMRGKAPTKPAPDFLSLRPRSDFVYLDTRHGQQERRGQICPQRVSVEIRPMERIPRRCFLMPFEGIARVQSFRDDGAVDGLDRDALGRKRCPLIGRAKRHDGCALCVQPYGHLPRRRILDKALHAPQGAAGYNGGAPRCKRLPSGKAAMGFDDALQQLVHLGPFDARRGSWNKPFGGGATIILLLQLLAPATAPNPRCNLPSHWHKCDIYTFLSHAPGGNRAPHRFRGFRRFSGNGLRSHYRV